MSRFNWKDLLWIAVFTFVGGFNWAAGADYYYYLTGLVELCRG